MKTFAILTVAATACAASAGGAGEPAPYSESLRPQFHFTARRGWVNDPVGLVHYDGEFHLCFQHTPNLPRSLAMTSWGHAVGTDLVHWRQIEDAIAPQDGCPAFSGSTVVDTNNTAGFQTGREKPLVAVYTAWGKGQCLAYSNDRGRAWTQHEGNPVLRLPNDDKRTFPLSARDPKVFWHQPTKKWVLLLYQNDGGQKGFGFFSSPDLKNWTRMGHLPGFYVCPDLFELPVEGQESRWVIMDWAVYSIGRFDGNMFTPETPPARLDYGRGYSANQTWSTMPPDDRRRVQIAWLRFGEYPGMPFDQQLTFPCELYLKKLSEGVRLGRRPVSEVSKLYAASHSRKDLPLSDKPISVPVGELLDVTAEIELGGANEIALAVRGATIVYNAKAGAVRFNKSSAPVQCPDGGLSLRILVDRTSVEIFINGGLATITEFFIPPTDSRTLEISAAGGKAKLRDLTIHELRSIWGN